jgi:hypothetical protein
VVSLLGTVVEFCNGEYGVEPKIVSCGDSKPPVFRHLRVAGLACVPLW